ncbi:unnamed protein product [Sphagnum tenellum]
MVQESLVAVGVIEGSDDDVLLHILTLCLRLLVLKNVQRSEAGEEENVVVVVSVAELQGEEEEENDNNKRCCCCYFPLA